MAYVLQSDAALGLCQNDLFVMFRAIIFFASESLICCRHFCNVRSYLIPRLK